MYDPLHIKTNHINRIGIISPLNESFLRLQYLGILFFLLLLFHLSRFISIFNNFGISPCRNLPPIIVQCSSNVKLTIIIVVIIHLRDLEEVQRQCETNNKNPLITCVISLLYDEEGNFLKKIATINHITILSASLITKEDYHTKRKIST